MSSPYNQALARSLNPVTDVTSADPMIRADSDMRYVLAALGGMEGRPLERCAPAEARKQPQLADAMDRILADIGRERFPPDGVSVETLTFPGPEGELPARLYKPAGHVEEGSAPMILHLADGLWVLDGLEAGEATARALARRTGAVVLSAGQRLAPEHKFPAAHDDAYAAWLWLMENARAFGGDPTRVALVGEGSGGNMAVDVALQARAERQKLPVHLVLLSPIAGNDFTRESAVQYLRARPFNTQTLRWSFRHAFANKADAAEPRVNLLAREDLGGLPPTTLILADIDPLLSDGEALGAALREAGVTLDMTVYEGVCHGFVGLARIVNKAMFALGQMSGNLNAAFARQ